MDRSGRLPRTLGLWNSVAIVIGITIGTGIFRSPASVARLAPHPLVMLGMWIGGGVITLCGALSIAELAAALPETGGFYVYLREGWGRRTAFLFGWSELVLIRASAVGGLAIVFGEYALRSFGVDPVAHPFSAHGLAAAVIAFAAAVNIRGVRLGAAIVGTATWLKFIAIAVLVAASLTLGATHGATLANLTTGTGAPITASSLGLAMVGVFWAYDGFADLVFVGGEVTDPSRNLPRAIMLGTLAIVILYVLANAAYLYVSPIEKVGRAPLVAADTMMALIGPFGAVLVSLFVMISSFSSLNGSMLAAPRVFFAMANDGLLFRAMGRVHPRYQTPHLAIFLSAVLGILLVLSQSFERLTSIFVLAIWPFYALSVAAIFRLRRLRPELPRPYRTFGYPLVPAIFIAAVVWFVANALVNDRTPTLITFALILIGVPTYNVLFTGKHARFR